MRRELHEPFMPDGVRTRNNKNPRSITFIIHRVIHSTLRIDGSVNHGTSCFQAQIAAEFPRQRLGVWITSLFDVTLSDNEKRLIVRFECVESAHACCGNFSRSSHAAGLRRTSPSLTTHADPASRLERCAATPVERRRVLLQRAGVRNACSFRSVIVRLRTEGMRTSHFFSSARRNPEHLRSDVRNGEGPGARHDPLRSRERDRVDRAVEPPGPVPDGKGEACRDESRQRHAGRGRGLAEHGRSVRGVQGGSVVINSARGPRPKLAISQARWGRGRRPSPPRHTGMTHREAFRLLELRTLV